MQHIAATEFATATGVPALADGEIHLWLLEQPGTLTSRARSAFAYAEAGRLLRAYSGAGSPPALARDRHGKPYVPDAGYPHFNLSHGGRLLALAFSHACPVGIDVEALQRRHASLDLARRFFAAQEAHALGTLEPADRQAAFVHLWSCKEAVLKALGRGLAFGLDRLRFELDACGPRALVEIAEDAGSLDDWQLCRFDAGADHAGALAWHGPRLRVRAWRATPATEPHAAGAALPPMR